jgi:hypothetical protein
MNEQEEKELINSLGKILSTWLEKNLGSEFLQLWRYADLQKAGFGDRHTILKKVRNGTFPAPQGENGKPCWTRETIQEYKNSLAPYVSKLNNVQKHSELNKIGEETMAR